jgi:hypothetical protein
MYEVIALNLKFKPKSNVRQRNFLFLNVDKLKFLKTDVLLHKIG